MSERTVFGEVARAERAAAKDLRRDNAEPELGLDSAAGVGAGVGAGAHSTAGISTAEALLYDDAGVKHESFQAACVSM